MQSNWTGALMATHTSDLTIYHSHRPLCLQPRLPVHGVVSAPQSTQGLPVTLPFIDNAFLTGCIEHLCRAMFGLAAAVMGFNPNALRAPLAALTTEGGMGRPDSQKASGEVTDESEYGVQLVRCAGSAAKV